MESASAKQFQAKQEIAALVAEQAAENAKAVNQEPTALDIQSREAITRSLSYAHTEKRRSADTFKQGGGGKKQAPSMVLDSLSRRVLLTCAFLSWRSG